MKTLYYDFGGMPARIILDADDTPDICEIFDPKAGAFVVRNELTLDVYDSYGSDLIGKEAFDALLEKVTAKAGT